MWCYMIHVSRFISGLIVSIMHVQLIFVRTSSENTIYERTRDQL